MTRDDFVEKYGPISSVYERIKNAGNDAMMKYVSVYTQGEKFDATPEKRADVAKQIDALVAEL